MVVMCLIVFAGCRYGIDHDFWNYQNLFFYKKYFDKVEPGFRYIIYFYKYFFNETFEGFIFFIAFLSLLFKNHFFLKQCHPFLCLLFYYSYYFISFEFNILRQSTSLIFIFISVEYAIERKFFRFFLLVALATCIHYSCIIFFPSYFLVNFSIKKRSIPVVIILIVLIKYFVWGPILSIALSQIANFAHIPMLNKLHYLTESTGAMVSVGWLKQVTILFLYVMLSDNDSRIKNPYFNLFLFSVLAEYFVVGIESFGNRLFLSYEIFMIPLFGNEKYRYTKKNVFIIFVILLVLLLFFIKTLFSSSSLPYVSQFFNF